jgi:hypothetical protein
MRIARIHPSGLLQEIIASNIRDRREAEIRAERAAKAQPNTFFAVLPDDRYAILSIAHRLPPLTASVKNPEKVA